MPMIYDHNAEPIDRGDGLSTAYVKAMEAATNGLNVDYEIARWPSDGADAAECERVHRYQARLVRATIASRSEGAQKAVVRTEVILEAGSSWRRAYVRVDRQRRSVHAVAS